VLSFGCSLAKFPRQPQRFSLEFFVWELLAMPECALALLDSRAVERRRDASFDFPRAYPTAFAIIAAAK